MRSHFLTEAERSKDKKMWKRFSAILCVTTLLALPGANARQSIPVYKQAGASIQDRVSDLLSRMTLEEKVAQLQGQATLPDLSESGLPTAAGIIKNGQVDEAVARRIFSDGIGAFTLLSFEPLSAEEGARRQNAIQAWVLQNTRLGIPVLFQVEALHGAVVDGGTSFPQAIALGSTWDPALIERMFIAVGAEARASGMALALAPVLDLARDPRYGRVEEMYSEDPFLTGTLGVAAIRGLQGGGDKVGPAHVIATAKHFIHGQPENGTNVGPNDVSERTMRDVFLRPFEMAVKEGRVGAVMPAYNENSGGIPSHADSWLLRDVLREEWGFAGMVMSDWGAIPELHSRHFVAASNYEAGVLALNSGVDLELPTAAGFTTLVEAVRTGKVKRETIDAAVSHVLAAKFNAGLFEQPYTDASRTSAVVGTREHAVLAREVADEAAILLKNEGSLLPLDPAKIKSIAVIGPNADKMRLGTYSGTPSTYVTVVDGVRRRLGRRVGVTYAEGVRISEPDVSPVLNRFTPYQPPSPENDAHLIAQAVDTARSADVVVLVLGGNETLSREGFSSFLGQGKPLLGDVDNLELPGRQNELVEEIARLGKPIVAVLIGGRPYSAEQLDRTVPAIVQGWYLGQETGKAITGILFGDVNPSGKLSVSIPRNVGQLPAYYYRKPLARLGYVGADNTPLYPFGHGLSYTTFRYGEPRLDRASIGRTEKVQLSVPITNTGSRGGQEVVQLYVRPRYSSTVQPVMRLAAFKRVRLDRGQTANVSFDIGPDQLSILDSQMAWTVEPGVFDIAVGPSSARTETVELTVAQ